MECRGTDLNAHFSLPTLVNAIYYTVVGNGKVSKKRTQSYRLLSLEGVCCD